jgi:threonine/homoserine/homoserine lactone efflux protein
VFSAFLIASVILAVTPGPGVLHIVTRSLTQGRRVGLASVAGVALGNLGNAVGAAIGLAGVFAAFLPQFMSADSPAIVRSLTLGSVFVAIAAVTDTAYALAAGVLAPVLTRGRRVRAVGRYLTGGSFIGLGIYTVARD